LLLELFEGGELFEAGSAPTGPEVEDDDAAAIVAEIDGAMAIVDGELRCAAVDLLGMIAAIAACGRG
jgi:hypothetical protein